MRGRRGITPVVAVILLLLMTIAAAGAAYLWVTKLQQLITERATSQWLDVGKKTQTKFGIDSAWRKNTTLCFTVVNQGAYSISDKDFNKTYIYLNDVPRAWIDASTQAGRSFAASETRVLCVCNDTDVGNLGCAATLTGDSGPWHGIPESEYVYQLDANGLWPLVTIKVTPAAGQGESYTYQESD